MKYLYLIALILSGITINAQSVKDPDSTGGFSIFRFGTSVREINDIQRDTASILNGKNLAVYRYNGDSLKNVFNVQVSEIRLMFYRDQLARIDIRFGTKSRAYTQEEFNQVQQALETRYGKTSGKLAMSGAVLFAGFRWEGEKGSLDHTRFTSPLKKRGKQDSIEGEISFTDKALNRQTTKGM
ncbi:MAG TPA: hypothetical protein VK541_21560 [Pedobacter sp.]|uniref:hypothetical protein n=1 Tax=Pedobacter sp. TaxID=1411316 RepID=UPI002C7BA343|nr:hypothetical protein [Pedobacter sp.]HMI05088.1 hypothetical protein [Pedobacter sp.]